MSTPGAGVPCTITWLEMTDRPAGPFPPPPHGAPVGLMRAVRPPVRWFLHLYDGVGELHDWTDRHRQDPEALRAWVQDDRVRIVTMFFDGWPGGFFALDDTEPGVCELAYFGLFRELHGRGLGRWLLGEALRMGWEGEVAKMTLNTNTLDHPAALHLYQRAGFAPVRREIVVRHPGEGVAGSA